MPELRISSAAQGTPEWLAARAGYLTGSRAADIVARRKDGQPGAAYHDYLTQIVAERLTGQPQETGIVTPWMTRGTELEPEARATLERHLDRPIFQCGFVSYDEPRIGCSVDGYLDGSIKHGIVELKCPKPTTHLRYLRDGKVPDDYRWQVLHNMLVTGAQSAIFASYCPQMPEHLRLVVQQVDREAWAEDLVQYWVTLKTFDAVVNEQVEYWRHYGIAE